ncbi:response regulator [Oxalobacteraceae bacterium]|nr:response regulator [Oxalobacteraceae bacterium]
MALSTAVYTTYVMQAMRSEAEQHLQERAERLAAVLSQALARPLFDINSAAVASVVDAAGATPEVLLLRVLAPTGNELASFVAPTSEPSAAIRVRRDIVFNDARQIYPVGTIELAFSRQQIDTDLRRQIVNTVSANLLLALAIVVSIFLVGRKAMRPFSDIQRALERLSHGETDIRLSGIGRSDQVGRLSEAVRSFRDTLTRLRHAETELRELNEGLEKKIEARTHELTHSMELARDSQDKLQAIVDTALDAVVRMDLRGRIVGWNRQAEAIFGWSREEALGLPLDNTIIPQRFRYDHRRGMQRYIASGQGAVLDTRIEIYGLRRDGSEFPIELAITQVKAADQSGFEFCAFIRDISERREREQKLVAANVMAEAANVAKSEFLANMSHEIRTPMSAVIGMAYLTLRTELTPKQHDYVSKIHRAALSLLGIINDILDFSKIEAGRLDVEQVPFVLDDVLAHVASVTAQRAADKQLEYLLRVPPAVPRALVGDPLRLGQVLINLVNNAIKFTASGELELCCEPQPGAAAGAARLRFSVRDTGIGISEEQQGKLFRAFSQANGSTSRQYGGTGLGLSISQQLVQLMGGNIELHSVPDQGSVFQFELEFALAPQAGPQLPAALPPALQQARLLLVDDHPLALAILHEALQALPLMIDTIGSGGGALAMIASADAAGKPYRMVLSDWQMPGMDGLELARRVRLAHYQHRAPEMVLVTAFGREEVQREADAAGIAGFLFKPIGQAALADALSAIVAPVRRPADVGASASQQQRYAARVLLVEDNPVNQEIAAELMAVQGISVDIASNGEEALRLLRAAGPQEYGLVLMDLEMPHMDGHAATAALRQEPRFADLPVVAMTAHALADVRERCIAQGMQDYLTKPIDPDRLYAVLARLLGHAMPADTPGPRAVQGGAQPGAAPLPRLPGLDSLTGLRNVAGNTALYLRLLERFRSGQQDCVQQLRAELAHGDAALACKRAHTVRGVAGNIGAGAVEEAARRVEEALLARADADPAQAGLFDAAADSALHEALDALETALQTLLAGLETQAAAGVGDAVPAPDGAAVRTALSQLGALLSDFSGDSPDYFDSVRSHLAAILPPATMDRLAGHLSRYEFDAASHLLSAAMQELELP